MPKSLTYVILRSAATTNLSSKPASYARSFALRAQDDNQITGINSTLMAKSRKRRVQPQAPVNEKRADTHKQQSQPKETLADKAARLLADRDFWIAALVFAGGLASSLWGASAVRIFCFTSTDSFWLIQTGLDIMSQMRLPSTDIYSFTHYGKPWVLYQWLFELVVGLIARTGGLQFLQAFVVVFSAFIFPVLGFQSLVKRGVNFWVAWWVTFAAAAAALTFMTLRPHLVSLLMVYLVLRLLESHWQKPGWRVLWLAPLFLIWANCHLMFSVGLAIVLAYWLSSAGVWIAGRRAAAGDPRRAGNWQRFRLLGAAFVIAVGASLANPYGWDSITYGLLTSGEAFWSAHIGEVMAPDFGDPVGVMILSYIILTILAFMISARRPSPAEGLVFLGLLAAGLTSYKLLPYFVTASMHGTGLRLQVGFKHLFASRIPARLTAVSDYLNRWASTPAYALAVLSLALVFGLTRPVLFPPWVPVAAANYLESHPADGHLFCSAKFGSYLIWRFHGQLPVFIDTRFDMYGPEFSNAYFKAHREGVGWRDIFEQHSIQCAMVETGSGIARILNQEPGWKRLYMDRDAAIFTRKE